MVFLIDELNKHIFPSPFNTQDKALLDNNINDYI